LILPDTTLGKGHKGFSVLLTDSDDALGKPESCRGRNNSFVSQELVNFYSIQFICIVHIDIRPRTSHRIRKNSQTTLHGEKSEYTFRRATEMDPSPGWTEQ